MKHFLFLNAKQYVSAMLIALLLPAAAFAQETGEETDILPPPEPFSDVISGSAHYVAIQYLFENRIITGFGDGTFRPNEPVNRVEALSMILNGATNLPTEELENTEQVNLPVDTVIDLNFPFETDIKLKTPSMETPIMLERTGVLRVILPKGGSIISGRVVLTQDANFTDVDKNEWYVPTLKRAVSLGIVDGYSDGTFRPVAPVKLTEALSMLFRTHRVNVPDVGENTPLPLDVPHDAWYAKHISYAVNNYLLTLSVTNKVFAGKELTRGELATLIYRFLQTQREDMQFGKASWYRDNASVIRIPERQEYHDQRLTAAHRNFPFGSVARVTNTRNGKYVDVVINDRGPFVPGRVVDLSKTAFSALEDPGSGIVSVQVKMLQDAPPSD